MQTTTMNNRRSSGIYKRVVIASCFLVLGVVLAAGLWPFHVPSNQVNWLNNENGLAFGRHGGVISSSSFQTGAAEEGKSGTLEILLEPVHSAKVRTILSFADSAHPGDPFSLLQNGESLEIRRHNIDGYGTCRTGVFMVKGAFRNEKTRLVTIVLTKQDTSAYLDGVLAKRFPISGASDNNLTGRLVLANSPTSTSSWSGNIQGLAIYPRSLTAAQVGEHYVNWVSQQTRANGNGTVALYLFNEREGTAVHNQVDAATDLTIPSHYFVLHPGFLVPFWREYRPRWSYWVDVAVNISGFLPLGFCFFAYFSSVKENQRATALVILLGLGISLTIELLQFFLPTRSSGTTDLITNTLGTAIGVMLYHLPLVQKLVGRAQEPRTEAPSSTRMGKLAATGSSVAGLLGSSISFE